MTGKVTVPQGLVTMLDQLGHTIVTATGVDLVVIDLVRPGGDLQVVSVVGDEAARAELHGTVESAQVWEDRLAASERSGQVFHLRHDSPLQRETVNPGASVHEERRETTEVRVPVETLLLPLTGADGTRLGVLGAHVHGRAAPSQETCAALESFAASAAMAIEHATLRYRAEASEEMFRSQAMSDQLTGLGSRSLLLDRLRHASTARRRGGSVMALAFLDLDDFKAINDDHSHAAGDRVLRTVAERIQTAVRAHDTVARWGGDEFLILLHPLSDEHAALGVVERILAAVAEPITDLGHPVTLTASIGISFWTSDAPVAAEELVRRADAAMYEAKRQGASRYAVFDAFDAEAARRLHLLGLLSRAVPEQRVVVEYQPVVRVADGAVVGVEALLRLRDDDGSLVYPLELLDRGAPPSDVALEVMTRAFEQVAGWTASGYDLDLSVNVSAQQIADIDTFAKTLRSTLVQTGLAPDRLIVELTEHTLLTTTAATLAGIDQLVDAGIRLSIDDFGTGHGSMTYLQTMPVHELKIDGSFLAAAPAQRAATAIVRSIALLANDLDLVAVAEGVEGVEQHDLVCASAVQLAQGIYYSPPLGAAALEKLLADAADRGTPLTLPGIEG